MRSKVFIPLLGVAILLSRLPFRAGMLNSFDSINYALALKHFDMRLAQPQAPGYPLYVLLGRLANLFFEPNQALIALSVVFSALAGVGLYLAGKEIFGERAGWIAALLAVTSPPVWYLGEMATPYTLDLFFSAISGWLCYRAWMSSDTRQVWPAAVVVGLAGALRLQSLVFLLPLLVFAVWQFPWRMKALGVGTALAIFGAFFLPAVIASGGPKAFLLLMIGIVPIFRDAETVVRTTRWVRFAANLKSMTNYSLRTVGELSLPFILAGWVAQPGCFRPRRDSKLTFLLAWLLPAWFFYFIIWPGNLGTMLVSMPPCFLLAGAGFQRALSARPTIRSLALAVLVLALAWNVLVFTRLPEAPFGSLYREFDNLARLRASEESYRSRLAMVREFPADGTVVYTDNYRLMQYYLPEYRTFTYPRFQKQRPDRVQLVVSVQNGKTETWKDTDPAALLPAGTIRVVFFERPEGMDLPIVEERILNGYRIRVLQLSPGQALHWTANGLVLDVVK
jgi:hypothetical protein